jgi:hypothetical protein
MWRFSPQQSVLLTRFHRRIDVFCFDFESENHGIDASFINNFYKDPTHHFPEERMEDS